MRCPNCGEDVRDHERNCPVCAHDCGYPNVRAAERPEEIRALEERLRIAEAAAASRGCIFVLADFRRAVRSSEAVLCRNLSTVMSLISKDDELYASFYELVGMGAKRPAETPVELQRALADDILFPHYRDKIRFAALSLNGRGVPHYGDCSLVLKELPIQDRATAFEENSLYFCMKRDLGLKRYTLPPGYRARWSRRDELAAAKLESALQPGTQADGFAEIIMKPAARSEEADFIEVHIYGPLHRRNIARLTARRPRNQADKAILMRVESSLKSIGATVEIYE
jgi:hypothetical protein